MFRTRLISGIVLVVLAILLVTKGGVLLYCVTAAISLIGMFELYRVMGIEKIWHVWDIMGWCGLKGSIM